MNTTATPTGRPLAVFSVVGYCDAAPEHEHRVISDGTRAYAYSATGEGEATVNRDGVLLSIACTQQHRHEPCYGRLEWRLDEPGTWSSDADAITLLEAYGTPVES